jgi:hypothetical protein
MSIITEFEYLKFNETYLSSFPFSISSALTLRPSSASRACLSDSSRSAAPISSQVFTHGFSCSQIKQFMIRHIWSLINYS